MPQINPPAAGLSTSPPGPPAPLTPAERDAVRETLLAVRADVNEALCAVDHMRTSDGRTLAGLRVRDARDGLDGALGQIDGGGVR